MSHARPRVSLDHVLVAVGDLGDSARRFTSRYGLQALEGGRHPGVGTANMIVPLESAYLELIAAVDTAEAAETPSGRRIAQAVAGGHTFAGWAVRTGDLDALRVHLRERGLDLPEPNPGARRRPDGVLLKWRTQFLTPFEVPSVLPFVIEWSVPAGMHPAEAAARHPSGAGRIRSIRLGDPHASRATEQLRVLLGDDIDAVVEDAGSSGVLSVEVETPNGVIVIR